MAFDFPATPSDGQIYAPAGGPVYVWHSPAWRTVQPGAVVSADARNRIVNPAFQVSQENGDTSTAAVSGYYIADQWVTYAVAAPGAFGVMRYNGFQAPNGSMYRGRFSVNTAKAALAAGDYVMFRTLLEGAQIADLKWGQAGAKQAVLRFNMRGPAGTYAVTIKNGASDRTFSQKFTIPANVDTDVVIVIPGDTVGVWPNDETRGMYIDFCLAIGTTYAAAVDGWQAGSFIGAAGQSNGVAVNGNLFLLGDVGLYADPQNTGVPPPFELPDQGDELIRCMRYWQTIYLGQVFGQVNSGTSYFIWNQLTVAPRPGCTYSGLQYLATGFPATAGTVSALGNAGIQESRVANATATFGRFASTVIINGRM